MSLASPGLPSYHILSPGGVGRCGAGRLPVNDQLVTAAEGICATAGVIRGPLLAHEAGAEGIACLERIVTSRAYPTPPELLKEAGLAVDGRLIQA